MSYFSEELMQEIEKDVMIERRSFLQLSSFALGSLMLGVSSPSLLAELEEEKNKVHDKDKISLETLIKQMTPKAENLIKEEKPDEESYLKELVALVKQLEDIKKAEVTKQKIKFTSMHHQHPVTIYQIRVKAGGALHFHDHREYNGVIKVLEGSAKVRNFDFIGDVEKIRKTEKFKIKETLNATLKMGDISQLSSTKDNIHDIRAGEEGVLFLDIFTFFSNKGTSKFIKVEDTPVDKEKKIYNASWEKFK